MMLPFYPRPQSSLQISRSLQLDAPHMQKLEYICLCRDREVSGQYQHRLELRQAARLLARTTAEDGSAIQDYIPYL